MASVNSHLKAAKKQSAMIEKTIARLKTALRGKINA